MGSSKCYVTEQGECHKAGIFSIVLSTHETRIIKIDVTWTENKHSFFILFQSGQSAPVTYSYTLANPPWGMLWRQSFSLASNRDFLTLQTFSRIVVHDSYSNQLWYTQISLLGPFMFDWFINNIRLNCSQCSSLFSSLSSKSHTFFSFFFVSKHIIYWGTPQKIICRVVWGKKRSCRAIVFWVLFLWSPPCGINDSLTSLHMSLWLW